jgi:tetratricopeptide (TPR) repeat protein
MVKTVLWPASAGNLVTPEEENQYKEVVDSSIAKVLERHRLLQLERIEAGAKILRLLKVDSSADRGRLPQEAEFWTWGLCDALQERSWALRQDDPAGMLHLAFLSVEAAQRLEPSRYGAQHVSDQLAQAWAGLANSYRIADKLSLAETALAQALKARQAGTGSPFLHARLAELSASLLCDQRQFPSAFRLLDFASSLYLKEHAKHDAGRALVKKGLHTGYTGDPEEGIRLLARALRLIDRNRDSRLVFQILHNILLFRVELGEFRPARIQLWEMRPLYTHHADHIAMVKLRGIEGRIYVGLRDFDRAKRAFLQVKEGFEREKMVYDAALISFDLAAIWLQEGKRKEVRQLVQEMLETFRARYIAREAIASLLMLRDAADRGSLSLDLLDMVAGFFRSLKDEPKAQDPGEMH